MNQNITSFDQFAEVFQIEIPEESLPKRGLSKSKQTQLEKSERVRSELIEIFHTYLQDIAAQLGEDQSGMQLKIRLSNTLASAVLLLPPENSEIESYPSIEALYMRTPDTKERMPVFLFIFYVTMPSTEEQFEVTIAQKIDNATCKGQLHVITESKEMERFFSGKTNASILKKLKTLFAFEDPRFEITIESMQHEDPVS